MDLSTQIVPAIVVVLANLLSGQHDARRWEIVTSVFGWLTLFSVVAWVATSWITADNTANDYLLQVATFCLLTALSRDWERILRPLFSWVR